MIPGRAIGDASVQRGLDICRQYRHPIDLLLTDVEMPGMSGFDSAGRALLLQPLMKILFMSGDADNSALHVEGSQGVRMFLAKPFDHAVLMSKIKLALGLAQSDRADERGSSDGLFSEEGRPGSPFAAP
ncbi:MAG: response regulator [Acidobacteriota bacterium]